MLKKIFAVVMVQVFVLTSFGYCLSPSSSIVGGKKSFGKWKDDLSQIVSGLTPEQNLFNTYVKEEYSAWLVKYLVAKAVDSFIPQKDKQFIISGFLNLLNSSSDPEAKNNCFSALTEILEQNPDKNIIESLTAFFKDAGVNDNNKFKFIDILKETYLKNTRETRGVIISFLIGVLKFDSGVLEKFVYYRRNEVREKVVDVLVDICNQDIYYKDLIIDDIAGSINSYQNEKPIKETTLRLIQKISEAFSEIKKKQDKISAYFLSNNTEEFSFEILKNIIENKDTMDLTKDIVTWLKRDVKNSKNNINSSQLKSAADFFEYILKNVQDDSAKKKAITGAVNILNGKAPFSETFIETLFGVFGSAAGKDVIDKLITQLGNLDKAPVADIYKIFEYAIGEWRADESNLDVQIETLLKKFVDTAIKDPKQKAELNKKIKEYYNSLKGDEYSRNALAWLAKDVGLKDPKSYLAPTKTKSFISIAVVAVTTVLTAAQFIAGSANPVLWGSIIGVGCIILVVVLLKDNIIN
ncbi:hypothetical protein KKC59_04835, partial [bacterium]|nr:hypothetical protein [bacterium]